MERSRPPTNRAVEGLLSDALGISVVISGSDDLAPWSVQRCHLRPDSAGLPAAVIVKWLRSHPEGFRTQLSQVHTERAALEFLSGLGRELAPRCLAADNGAGVLVLEDLHPSVPLRDLIAGDNARLASTGLAAFARTLGALHAATIGHEAGYYERRGRFGRVDPHVERDRFLGPRWHDTPPSIAALLGVALPGLVERDLRTVLAIFREPGQFLAFSNGDAGSNNFMFDGLHGRLIDFEFAGYRHALADAVCLFVPGPAWMTVADALTSGLEDEYRQALGQAVPQAHDDHQFGRGIAAASLAYAIMRLNRISVLNARPHGDRSRAQMVSALEQAAAVAETHRSLTHLAGWARHVAEALRRQWPDTDIEFNNSRYVPR